jgi:hypothetical protein
MKLSSVFPLALGLCLSLSAAAQEHQGGQRRASEPPARRELGAEVDRRDNGRVSSMPHVSAEYLIASVFGPAGDDGIAHERQILAVRRP